MGFRQILKSIRGIHPPSPNCGPDSYFWSLTLSAIFSLKSITSFLEKAEGNPETQLGEFDWKTIWRRRGPPRIKTHHWLIAHGCYLQTPKELNARWLILIFVNSVAIRWKLLFMLSGIVLELKRCGLCFSLILDAVTFSVVTWGHGF